MWKWISFILLTIALAVAAILEPNEWWVRSTLGFVTGVWATVVHGWLTDRLSPLLSLRDRVRLQTALRNEQVRLSVSALVRIKVGDKYLLVPSGRIKGQYQPVGGVLHYLPSAVPHLKDLGAVLDTGYQHDSAQERDLRLSLPGKNVCRFLRWLQSGRDREQSPWREFHEELVEPQILPAAAFPWVEFGMDGTHIGGVHWSNHFRKHEILISFIYEPVFRQDQLAVIRDLVDRVPALDDYLFATTGEIEALGHDVSNSTKSHRIGHNATWVLEGRV